MLIVTIKQFFATNNSTIFNNLKGFFSYMEKNIKDMIECIRKAESNLKVADSYLKDAKDILRKIGEK